MTTYVWRSLKAIAKRLSLLLVFAVMLLSLSQTAVMAASSSSDTKSVGVPAVTEPIPDEQIDEMKEQRREWQSRVSSSRDVQDDDSNSLGETIKDKLNLDEITENYNPDK
jgi:hypothetical protein